MPSRKAPRCRVSPPLDPLLSVLLDLLDEAIRAGPGADAEDHDALALALLPMPLVCKEAARLVLQHTSAGGIGMLAYEAARLGMEGPFFYDCIPANILTAQNTGDEVGFTCPHGHTSPIEQFHMDLQESACFLSGSPDNEVFPLTRHHDAPDMAHASVRVRVFIGRARHVAAEIQHKGRCMTCRVCSQTVVIDDTKLADEHPHAKYWRGAGGQPLCRSRLPVCSSVCAEALSNDVETAQGISGQELRDYDSPPSGENSRRLHAALRQAFRRNELVARRLRRVAPPRFISEAEAAQVRVFSSTMLNVDLALLMCCERAASHPSYRDTVLPSHHAQFRSHEPVWINPLLRIIKLYEHMTRNAPPTSPVCTLLNKPRWLAVIVHAFRDILNTSNRANAPHSASLV
tara:strand:+ start:669 stop:1874 length:1206 start_codon:yes stop_codon:yes gene_type:complete